MADDIGIFLARAVPWPADGVGYINIHAPYVDKDGKKGMSGRAFITHDAASRYTNFRSSQNVDLFVCMSRQAQAEPRKDGKGRDYRRAIRDQAYALLLCSLWIDVDIKNGFFNSTQHALDEFHKWRISVGLPDPTFIVFTGSGGFHAHWCPDEPIDLPTWQPLANALANAAASFKPLPGPNGEERRLDLGVTVDSARLLRIPGTWNHKHNPPHAAMLHFVGISYPLSTLDNILAPYKGAYVAPVRPTAKRVALGKPSPVFAGMVKPTPLTAGLDDGRWEPEIEEVMDACPWIKRVWETGGAGCGEPEWVESLKLAFFCVDGPVVALWLSNQHPGYTEQETDQKFAQIEERRDRYGWPQCKTIHNAGGHECTACPHLPAGKSPLNFVALPAPAPIMVNGAAAPIVTALALSQAHLPLGYIHDKDGYVWVKVEDKHVKVCEYPLFNLRTEKKVKGIGRFSFAFDTYTDAADDLIRVVVPYQEAKEHRALQTFLSDHGMLIEDQGKMLRSFMVSFVEQLRLQKIISSVSEPYGWSIDRQGNRTGFVCGDKRYNCAGITQVSPADSELAIMYSSLGSLDCFKKNAALVTQQERYDLITVLAAGFGGVLIPLTGLAGTVLAIYSPQSGLGKSHVMRIAQSIWADPTKAMAILNDTANYVGHRLGLLRNLPFFFDEIKLDKDMAQVVNTVFGMTQGRTKGRMTASIESRQVHEFSTMMMVASNSSLTDYVNDHVPTSTAGLQRIFEIPVQPNHERTGLINPAEATLLNGALNQNYGNAGAVYSEFLGKNIPAIEEVMKATYSQLNTIIKGEQEDRFWVGTMTACLIGARIANKLDLTCINERKLMEFLINNFERLRSTVHSSSSNITTAAAVERYVADYVNTHRKMTLTTSRMPTKGTGRPPVNAQVLDPNNDFRDGIRVRYARDDQLVRLSLSDFRMWLKRDRKVSDSEVINSIKQTMGATTFQTNLAIGTRFESAREMVLEIDVSNLPGFIS